MPTPPAANGLQCVLMRTTPPVIATFIWASVAHSSAMLNALVTPSAAAGATAVPFARQRAAMDCAAWLARRLASVDYRAEYAAWRAESTAFPNRSGSTACGVLAQSERCANSVLVKRIIRASGVLRGLTSCRYSGPRSAARCSQ